MDQELRRKSYWQLSVPIVHSSEFCANACREFWAEMSRNDNIMASADVYQRTISHLQQYPNMALLLQRYIQTDALMRLLEMVHDYMDRMPDASTGDGAGKIACVFPMNSHARTKLTPHGAKTERILPKPEGKWCIKENLVGEPFSALQVAGLLRAIESEQVDAIMLYSLASPTP